MPAGATSNNLAGKLTAAIKSDPKRTGVLAVLVAVLGVMWGRMAMQGGGGPQSADAAPANHSASDNAVVTGGQGAGRDAVASEALVKWREAPVSPVVRNLFAVQLDHYAQQGARSAAPAATSGEGFWDELAKSISTQADQKKQHDIFVQNLIQQAGELEVQTIVMGAVPTAAVNGQVVGVGSVVAAGSGSSRAEFRVLKIEARRIIVEREGIKLEIPMK